MGIWSGLARTGFDAQQTDEPAPAERVDNLWEPADGPKGHDHGAHGIFDDRAWQHSLQAVVARHPGRTAAALTGALLGATVLRLARR